MEKGKAPAKGYYRGSSSNANPLATTNEHDVVDDRTDAVCIDLTNDTEEATEVGIHRHFSIRGYVAEIRRNNPLFCSLFPTGNDGTNNSVQQLPPLDVPRFRWWRCDHCVHGITGAVDASANASEGHGARANNVNEHDENIETNCPLVEDSVLHPGNLDSVETCAPSSDGKNAVPLNAASEERRMDRRASVEKLTIGGCRNQQARRKSRKIRTLIDLLSSCERQLSNEVSAPDQITNEASGSVPRLPANDSPGHEAALPPSVRRKAPNTRELGGGRRRAKAPTNKRKMPDTELEAQWTLMRHRITRTVNEMSGDGSLKRAAEMSRSSGSRNLSLPLPRDDAADPLPAPKRARGNYTFNEVEDNLQTPVARSSRAEIRHFDLNVPAEPEDGSAEEERLRSSNAELLPCMSMAAGNPIPAEGANLPINGGLATGAAPVLIQIPLEPSPCLNPGRSSAFRRYQRPELASPLVAGSSNQHSNAEDSSSRAAGARAGSSRGETEDCQINRNPADFSVVGSRNPYMIGSEDPKRRKKISRAEKGKRKIDESG